MGWTDPAHRRSIAALLHEIAMIEQYKKTLVPTQIMILVVAAVVLLWSHRLVAAMAFFLVMQLGGVIGAVWATRLKRKLERAATSR